MSLFVGRQSYPAPFGASFSAAGLKGTASAGAVALALTFSTMTPATIAAAGVTANRSGLAWQYDATGKITTCPNNYLLYSSDFTNAAYTKSGGAITANSGTNPDGSSGVQTFTATSGPAYLFQTSVFASGVNTLNSVYVKRRTGSGVVRLRTSGNIDTPVTVTSDWTRVVMPYVGNGVNNTWVFSVDTTGDAIDVFGAQAERVTYETSPRTYNPTTSAAYYGPRLDYDPVTLAAKGLLNEPAATNQAWHCRDLTNAVWTKTNITAALDQTGRDGVSNTASKITATAANGTCLQAITLASSQRTQSAWVKRLTGSGVVEMTTDGGTTWTAITLTGSWTRQRIPSQTLANPSIGFRIVTSGDALAVDLVQNETGPTMTSEIFTTGAAVSRAAENIKFTPPVSVSNIRYTFDDDTTQDAAVTGGVEYTIPTSLNRPWIKSIVSI